MIESRPARAMRGAGVVLILIVALRIPAIEARFRQALRAGGAPLAAFAAARDGQAVAGASIPVRMGELVAQGSPASFAVQRMSVGQLHALVSAQQLPRLTTRLRAAEFALAIDGEPVTAAPASFDMARPDAGASATAAYARLAAGDRRGAVQLFDAAIDGDDPRAPAWRRQRDALIQKWSASAYSIVRTGGDPTLAVRPVLGGGQSGGGVAFTPDPLSPRPIAVTLRGSVANDDSGRSAFVAVGVQWHPFSGVTVAAERLIAAGPVAPNAWTARLAAGTERNYGRLRATAYGEGGIVGSAVYAAIQGRAAVVFHLAGVEIDPGGGTWSSLQRDRGSTVDRVDTGPGVVARRGRFAAEADYRFRVAGNAAPGSGPVLTLSAAF